MHIVFYQRYKSKVHNKYVNAVQIVARTHNITIKLKLHLFIIHLIFSLFSQKLQFPRKRQAEIHEHKSECEWLFAQRLTGYQSKVYSASCTKSFGVGSSPPATLMRMTGRANAWNRLLVTTSHCIITAPGQSHSGYTLGTVYQAWAIEMLPNNTICLLFGRRIFESFHCLIKMGQRIRPEELEKIYKKKTPLNI